MNVEQSKSSQPPVRSPSFTGGATVVGFLVVWTHKHYVLYNGEIAERRNTTGLQETAVEPEEDEQ